MRVDDGFDDGKPEPGAIAFALTRRVDAVEAVEEPGEVRGRNFGPGFSTVMTALSPCIASDTRTVWPDGVCRMAFDRRLLSARRSISRSPGTVADPVRASETPRSSAHASK